MGTTTPYIHIYKPADSEVFDQQLNDNADYDLIDAQVLLEHNLIIAHTNASAPHTGHAVLATANTYQGQQRVVVTPDTSGVLVDTPPLAGAGVLTGSRHTLRAHSYDTLDHQRDFILRARATSNAGSGIFEILTALDGGTPSVIWSMTHLGVLGSAPPPELIYANTKLSPSTSIDLTTLVNIMFVYPTTSGIAIHLPDSNRNRPITIYGPPTGQVSVTATGATISGGSADLTSGAIQNGVVVAGDSFTYTFDGTNWKS